MTLMIFLLAAGIILVCLEVFLPGGIAGILGAAALIGSVWLGFSRTDFGPTWLMLTISLTLACILLSVRLVARSPMGKKLFLNDSEKGFQGTDKRLKELAGCRGKALSDLRPVGIAAFGDQRVDVLTGGEYITKDTPIEVIEVSGNRVVVAKITGSTKPEQST